MKTIRKRRRREAKTDYKARLIMLKSAAPRIVFRKTNKYLIGQYVKGSEAQDKVIVGVNSKELVQFGWPEAESIKSIPAAYLLGFLLGRRVVEREGKVKAILDLGLQRNTKKSRIFSFLNGVSDSGLNISFSKELAPEQPRLEGKNIKAKIDFKKIKEKIEND
jgi:large subunit ribosomal protein L18